MSITDELRDCIRTANRSYEDVRNPYNDREILYIPEEELTAIADRIDERIEREYVKLPVDADGVPIHVGDRVENNERVVRIVLTDGSWEPSVYVEKLPNILHEHFCHEISHYHEPTVDDVLREFAEKVTDSQIPSVHPTYEEAIAEYAAKLRLAKEDA